MKIGPAYTPARFGEPRENGRVQCTVCPRQCVLAESQTGRCGVRVNQNGQLMLAGYGRTAALAIDPIEKKPLYHFLPGSRILSLGGIGCNLTCRFCQNNHLSTGRNLTMLDTPATPETVAEAALQHGCSSVAFTYNEPVIALEYVIDVAQACRARGLRTVAVTAGYICQAARDEFFAVMDAANIDLKSLSEAFYTRLCGAHLQPVLDTLRAVHNSSTWLEITNLLIPGENDEERHVTALASWITQELSPEVPLHLSAFHPAHHMRNNPATPPKTVIVSRRLAMRAGLKHVYTGNILDREGGTTYCRACGTDLMVRDGYNTSITNLKDGCCTQCGTPCAGHL